MSSRAIEVAIQKLAGVHKADDLVCMVCTVQSVNEGAATCTCMGDNDIIIPNVKLQAGVCDGLLILPVVGSTVIIAMSKYNDPFVFMISDVDKFYLMVAGNSAQASITITNDGKIVLNNGSFDGLIKVIDPNDSTAGLLAKLNNIEKLLNDLITKYNDHTHIVACPPGGGSVTSAVTTSVEPDSINPPTTESDLVNPNITHG